MKIIFSKILLVIFPIVLIGIFFIFLGNAMGFWTWLAEPPREQVEKIRKQWGGNIELPEEKRKVTIFDALDTKTFTNIPTYRCLVANKKLKELEIRYGRHGYVCDNELWIEEFAAGSAPFLFGPFDVPRD